MARTTGWKGAFTTALTQRRRPFTGPFSRRLLARQEVAYMSEPRGLGAVFDEHVADEFVVKDVAATMSTMTGHPVVLHLPTLAGGVGVDEVTGFYTDHFIGQWPDDVEITRLSRTVDAERVVDEPSPMTGSSTRSFRA